MKKRLASAFVGLAILVPFGLSATGNLPRVEVNVHLFYPAKWVTDEPTITPSAPVPSPTNTETTGRWSA